MTPDLAATPFFAIPERLQTLLQAAVAAQKRAKAVGNGFLDRDPVRVAEDAAAVNALAEFCGAMNRTLEVLMFNLFRDTPHVFDAFAETIIERYVAAAGAPMEDLRNAARVAAQERERFKTDTDSLRAEFNALRKEYEALRYELHRGEKPAPKPSPMLKVKYGDGVNF